MSRDDESSKRNLLGRQPARAILIDISPPLDGTICSAVCDSLEDLFSVACNIAGPSRIPLVSLFLLAATPEVLLPLSSLKGNFVRIQNALKSVKSSVSEVSGHLSKTTSCIAQAVQQAIEQFRRQVCAFTQPGLSSSQLEVIVISCHSGDFLSRQIESVADTLLLQHLKRIVAVSIQPLMYGAEEGMDSTSQGSGQSAHSNSLTSGLVDVVTLDADSLSLLKFFYGWLMDCGSDREHLHLLLPPQYTGDGKTVIKCDLQERVLNPAQLPHNTSYSLHPESATCKMVFASTSKAAGITIPLHRVNITAILPSTSICESLLFGMPLIVQPTSCWKVDWDELEENQQNFRALCHLLQKKDQVMLGQLAPSTSPSPCGWFLFFSGPNQCLLVRSVASRELLLPSLSDELATEDPSEDSMNTIDGVLAKVEQWDSFNPLTLNSGLYDSLKAPAKGNRNTTISKRKCLDENTPSYGGWSVSSSKLPHMEPGLRPTSTYTAYTSQQAPAIPAKPQPRQYKQRATRKPLKAFLTELE